MKNFVARLAIALMITGGAFVLQANAQANSAQQPTSAQQQPQSPDNMQAQDAKPFSGTIVKEKGKLVLKDSATGMSYKLDDQDKAKQYEGKQVKVTGKLDPSSNVITVQNIEAGAGS